MRKSNGGRGKTRIIRHKRIDYMAMAAKYKSIPDETKPSLTSFIKKELGYSTGGIIRNIKKFLAAR